MGSLAEIHKETDLSTIRILVSRDEWDLAVLVRWTGPDDHKEHKELVKNPHHLFVFLCPLIQKFGLLDNIPSFYVVEQFYNQLSMALSALLVKDGLFLSWYHFVGIFSWDKKWCDQVLQEIPRSKANAAEIYNVIIDRDDLRRGKPLSPEVEDAVAGALQRLNLCNCNPGALREISGLPYDRLARIATRKLAEKDIRESFEQLREKLSLPESQAPA